MWKSIPLGKVLCTSNFFMRPKFWLSLEFCAFARPGPSIMNSGSVDRQVSSMLDSESVDRHAPSLVFSWFMFFSAGSTLFEEIFTFWRKNLKSTAHFGDHFYILLMWFWRFVVFRSSLGGYVRIGEDFRLFQEKNIKWLGKLSVLKSNMGAGEMTRKAFCLEE